VLQSMGVRVCAKLGVDRHNDISWHRLDSTERVHVLCRSALYSSLSTCMSGVVASSIHPCLCQSARTLHTRARTQRYYIERCKQGNQHSKQVKLQLI